MKTKHTAYVIDTKGNRWKWNCGWWHVNSRGEAQNHTRPLGHAQFRRAVKLLDAEDKKQREVLHGMDKPGRHWRRFVQRESWVHELFGACYLLASDGCHAIIETIDGDHEKVCFENLSENTGVKLPPRFGAEKKPSEKVRERKQAEVSALISKYITTLVQ